MDYDDYLVFSLLIGSLLGWALAECIVFLT